MSKKNVPGFVEIVENKQHKTYVVRQWSGKEWKFLYSCKTFEDAKHWIAHKWEQSPLVDKSAAD